MVQFYATFQAWLLSILKRIFKRFDKRYPSSPLGQREQICGEREELDAIISNGVGQSAIANFPQEIILLILKYIPYHVRPQMDVFTSMVSASQSSRSLDVAAIAAPRICSSWNAPGTKALYERITLYTEAQCILLKRTLQDHPSLPALIRFLRLPSTREGSIVSFYKTKHCRATPASVVRLSAEILAICRHVQEVDVLQHNDSLINSFNSPYLLSLRVRNSTTEFSTTSHSSIRFHALQELTLNGYHFDSMDLRFETLWPELTQLKSLRLEDCIFDGEDLTQILSRGTTKLRSLALYSVLPSFRKGKFPSLFADSLEELWIEDCHNIRFDSHFASFSALRCLHIDWFIFPMTVPFAPPSLLCISVAIPSYAARSSPNYVQFEATILSLDLPKLKMIRIKGQRGFPLLKDEPQLRRNLDLKNINLFIEVVHRGEARPNLSVSDYPFWVSYEQLFPPFEKDWREWLYM